MKFIDYASRIWLPDCSRLAINWKHDNDVTVCGHDVIVKVFWGCFVSHVKLVTGLNFMSISSVVLELWQFSFLRNWPEIQKLEILPSEIWSIFENWGELRIQNFVQMFLMKFYWMLQSVGLTTFIFSKSLRKKQQGGLKCNKGFYVDVFFVLILHLIALYTKLSLI